MLIIVKLPHPLNICGAADISQKYSVPGKPPSCWVNIPGFAECKCYIWSVLPQLYFLHLTFHQLVGTEITAGFSTSASTTGVRGRSRRPEFVCLVAAGDRDHPPECLRQPHLQRQQQLQHAELAGPAGEARGFVQLMLKHFLSPQRFQFCSRISQSSCFYPPCLQLRQVTMTWQYQRQRGATACRAVIDLTWTEVIRDLCCHTSPSSDICRRHSTPRYPHTHTHSR